MNAKRVPFEAPKMPRAEARGASLYKAFLLKEGIDFVLNLDIRFFEGVCVLIIDRHTQAENLCPELRLFNNLSSRFTEYLYHLDRCSLWPIDPLRIG